MRSDIDHNSMKILLKQVYSVHSAKVKGLEDEVEELKKSLQESENKLRSVNAECKRCVELEEAFNSCKAALHEQSKWFENLGQKFSTFNTTSESKISGEKDARTIIEDAANCEGDASTQVASVKKLDLSTNPKMYFLKNLMSLDADTCQESLDLSTAPFQKNIFQEYSTLNPDSLVLVPNTVDLTGEILEMPQAKNRKSPTEDSKIPNTDNKSTDEEKHLSNSPDKDGTKKRGSKGKSKKRSSDSSDLESNNDKSRPDKEKSSPISKKLKHSKHEEDSFSSRTVTKSNENISPKNQRCKSEDLNTALKKPVTPALNVKINKISSNDSGFEKRTLNSECNVSKDDFQVSPSLIPLNEKTNSKALGDQSSEDINDFIVPSSGKKAVTDEGTWTSCNKKKLSKKTPSLKPIKSSSRFKMQLDSLPPNYKKPSYRQTKLSKSIFQPKPPPVSQEECGNVKCIVLDDEKSSDFEINLPSTSADLPATSGGGKTVDFDATCIPDNFQFKMVSPLKVCRNNNQENMRITKDLDGDSDEESSPEMIIEQLSGTPTKEKLGKKDYNVSTVPRNSFDRLPRKEEPNYKYKEETVRKKSERKQLAAFDCKECEKYYDELGLSEEERKKRMHKCSRHRSKFAAPPTPEHFWELEFPDTQECKSRGYLNETQKVKLKSHRKRPL